MGGMLSTPTLPVPDLRARSARGAWPRLRPSAHDTAGNGGACVEQCDVIIVTGDAYVDHPSFGMAIVGRVLEAQGLRVASSPSRTGTAPMPSAPSVRRDCSLASPPAYGFDGQSLHRRQARAQR